MAILKYQNFHCENILFMFRAQRRGLDMGILVQKKRCQIPRFILKKK